MSRSKGFFMITLCYNIVTLAVHNREQVRELAPGLCPYTNFCSTDAWKISPNDTDLEQPCCLPCSCDDDCWILDNCCPDKELINGPRPPILPCMDSYMVSRTIFSNPYEGFYRVIDSCPSSEDRSTFEPKCSRINRTSLEDFLWVSDPAGRIYLNIHCAKCHGINESLTWQIQTKCHDILRADFGNCLETLLSPACNIINTAPNEIVSITNRYKCYSSEKLRYTSCDENMTHYNPDVEAACKESTWPYIKEFTYAKNVFCVMCAEGLPTAPAGLCKFYTDKDPDGGYTFLLDYTSLSAEPRDEESTCGLDEIFDDFTGLCRKLLCPFGTAPFYGRCRQLVSKINGMYIKVIYYFDVIRNNTSLFTNYGNDAIWNVIHSQFMESMDLSSNCEVCSMTTLRMTEERYSTSALAFEVSLEFSAECDYGLTFTKLSDMRGKVIEMNVNGTTILMLIVRSDKPTYPMGKSQKIFEDIFKKCGHPRTLSLDGMTCPRLELNYMERDLFSQTDIKKRAVFSSFFTDSASERNVTKLFVCLDKYIFVMSQINRAAPSADRLTLQMLPAVLSVLALHKM